MPTGFDILHQIDRNESAHDPVMQNLMASLTNSLVNGKQFPLFPSIDLQLGINGTCGELALLEAYPFYRRILGYARLLGIDVASQTRVLDFGCGWGRHLRFLWQIVDAENLYGTDVDQSFVELCQSLFPSGNFTHNDREPPLPFSGNFFDIVWSYSVFSHLNEEYNLKWMHEICRVLRPGGMFILTTEGHDFIDFCDSFRGKTNFESDWHRLLSEVFKSDVEVIEVKRKFERGEFLFLSNGDRSGPRDGSFYGDAIVPRKFFEDRWTRDFRIVDFYDPRNLNEQSVVVAQKL